MSNKNYSVGGKQTTGASQDEINKVRNDVVPEMHRLIDKHGGGLLVTGGSTLVGLAITPPEMVETIEGATTVLPKLFKTLIESCTDGAVKEGKELECMVQAHKAVSLDLLGVFLTVLDTAVLKIGSTLNKTIGLNEASDLQAVLSKIAGDQVNQEAFDTMGYMVMIMDLKKDIEKIVKGIKNG